MFSFGKPDHISSIVLDIGSSTVGVAVICTHADGQAEIIWQHREYALLGNSTTQEQQLKNIKTALTNAFLEVSQHGSRALKESGHSTTISQIQATIAAPWSYTITKTITLKDEHPFEINKELVDELVESAKKQSKLVFSTNEVAKNLGLELTHGEVLNITANGYTVTNPMDQEVREVALSYIETAIAQEVTQTLQEAQDKFFPQASLTKQSTMYAFYLTMRNLRPNTSEVCLVDVTGEATEIGIVRDDVLLHTTHIPVGIYTLARQLAEASDTPKQETYGYMKDDPEEILTRLPEKSRDDVLTVLQNYHKEISALFMRTGDKLTIPATMFMRSDGQTQKFFVDRLEKAAEEATGKNHTVHPVTAKVLNLKESEDLGVAIAANFLSHKGNYHELLHKK